MRKTFFILVALFVLGLVSTGLAADYKLNNGQTVSGEIIESGSNDAVALIKTPADAYEKVPWGNFSQEDLKEFKEKYASNKKIFDAIEPLIEVSAEEKAKVTEVPVRPVPRLEQPAKGSVIGSLFQSAPGIFLVLLILGANIFAGYEIAIFRAQPVGLVAGLAAIPVLGFISNIVFLSMPTRMEKKTEQDLAYESAEANAQTFVVPGQDVAEQEAATEAAAVASGHAPAASKPEVFSRGQFTFNKRFFETKFANFFGIIRREEDRTKVLIFKTGKGQFTATRITRITQGEIYIQSDRGGGASVEEAIHFAEIQEVTLKHTA